MAGVLSVQIGDRKISTNCIVGPPTSEVLICQIILEGLDLILDPVKQKLSVGLESSYLPLLNLK